MDGRAWSLYRNPVQLLINFDHDHWETKLEDEHFRSLYQKVIRMFETYMAGSAETWFAKRYPDLGGPIAYFCMEYGLDPCLPIYSGGLGVLAGDHLKSASDLGLPLVGGPRLRNSSLRDSAPAAAVTCVLYLRSDSWRTNQRASTSHSTSVPGWR